MGIAFGQDDHEPGIRRVGQARVGRCGDGVEVHPDNAGRDERPAPIRADRCRDGPATDTGAGIDRLDRFQPGGVDQFGTAHHDMAQPTLGRQAPQRMMLTRRVALRAHRIDHPRQRLGRRQVAVQEGERLPIGAAHPDRHAPPAPVTLHATARPSPSPRRTPCSSTGSAPAATNTSMNGSSPAGAVETSHGADDSTRAAVSPDTDHTSMGVENSAARRAATPASGESSVNTTRRSAS